MKNKLVTKQELADYLRVCPKTIDDYRRKGLVQSVKVGRKILFQEEAIKKALKK